MGCDDKFKVKTLCAKNVFATNVGLKCCDEIGGGCNNFRPAVFNPTVDTMPEVLDNNDLVLTLNTGESTGCCDEFKWKIFEQVEVGTGPADCVPVFTGNNGFNGPILECSNVTIINNNLGNVNCVTNTDDNFVHIPKVCVGEIVKNCCGTETCDDDCNDVFHKPLIYDPQNIYIPPVENENIILTLNPEASGCCDTYQWKFFQQIDVGAGPTGCVPVFTGNDGFDGPILECSDVSIINNNIGNVGCISNNGDFVHIPKLCAGQVVKNCCSTGIGCDDDCADPQCHKPLIFDPENEANATGVMDGDLVLTLNPNGTFCDQYEWKVFTNVGFSCNCISAELPIYVNGGNYESSPVVWQNNTGSCVMLFAVGSGGSGDVANEDTNFGGGGGGGGACLLQCIKQGQTVIVTLVGSDKADDPKDTVYSIDSKHYTVGGGLDAILDVGGMGGTISPSPMDNNFLGSGNGGNGGNGGFSLDFMSRIAGSGGGAGGFNSGNGTSNGGNGAFQFHNIYTGGTSSTFGGGGGDSINAYLSLFDGSGGGGISAVFSDATLEAFNPDYLSTKGMAGDFETGEGGFGNKGGTNGQSNNNVPGTGGKYGGGGGGSITNTGTFTNRGPGILIILNI